MTGTKSAKEDAVTCPHRSAGCRTKFHSRDYDHHVTLQCLYRPAQCEGCLLTMKYKDLYMHQKLRKCLDIKCKRDMVASARRIKSDLTHHRQEIMSSNLNQTREKVKSFHSRVHEKLGYSPRVPSTPKPNHHQSSYSVSSIPAERSSLPGDSCSEGSPTEEPSEKVYIPPSPSRLENTVAVCHQCNKAFRERANHSKACIWHKGVSTYMYTLQFLHILAVPP